MKKRFMRVALICAVIGSLSLSSCIGSFSLFNKLLAWNKTIDDKFVNEAVFFAFWILPVYPVSFAADLLVINSIEFWTGSSPIAKTTKTIEGEDGKYLVERDSKGYTITSLNDNRSMRLNFDEATQTWSVLGDDGKDYPLMTFVDENHLKLPTADGGWMIIEKNQAGLYAYQQAVQLQLFAAK